MIPRLRARTLSRKQADEAVVLYTQEDMKLSDIARKMNTTSTTVSKELREKGVKVKRKWKYRCDHEFFSVIDTEVKAYWLGFLMADGCVASDTNTIAITLQDRDGYIMERMAKEMKTNSPVTYRDRRFKHYQDTKSLRIYSGKIKQDLIRLGCTPRKSLTLQYPHGLIPDKLMHHFMRGFFDGDGGITTTHGVPNSFMVCGPEGFISDYQDILIREVGLSKTKLSYQPKIVSASYGGNGNLHRLFNFLYKDATIFLHRKFDLFQEAIGRRMSFKIERIDTKEVIEVNNLLEFCRQNDCHLSNMYKTYRGDRPHHHGYRLLEIVNPTSKLGPKQMPV